MRVLRLCAGVSALASLAALGWHAHRPLPSAESDITAVTLWTAGATTPSIATPGIHVSLTDAPVAPATAERLPDLAAVRRRFPALTRLTVEGDGLDASDTAAAAGLDVRWELPPRLASAPQLVALTAPPRLPLGQRFSVQGRLAGLSPASDTRLTLEGPDGAKNSLDLRPAADGTAAFSLASAATTTAPGAFEWTLRLAPAGETVALGAEVVPPDLPRLLLLSASPTQELGRLQRWLSETGASYTARTRISTERDRFTASPNSPADFPTIDAVLLEKFDLVLADESALRALSAPERTALSDAIRRTALGLLVHGAPGTAPTPDEFFLWTLRADPRPDDADQARVARLRLADGTELAEPVGVLPLELVATPDQLPLARDTQDRTLVAARRQGRGFLARTLVAETWRWPIGGHAESYAAYWSALFATIARPAPPGPGRWHLPAEATLPVVGQRLELRWLAAADAPLPEAEVIPSTPGIPTVGPALAAEPSRDARDRRDGTPASGGPTGQFSDATGVATFATAPVRLQLARDPAEPTRALAAYWPTRPGWHIARALPSGPSLPFYVQAPSALPGLRRQARHNATALVVSRSLRPPVDGPAPTRAIRRAPPWHAAAWFALFVASAGYLWRERRGDALALPTGPIQPRTETGEASRGT